MASDHLHEECALHPGRCVPIEPQEISREGEKKQGETGTEHDNPTLLGMTRGAPSPNCRFEHICSRCFRPHKKSACRGRGETDKEPFQ